ncbi:MAG: TIGR02757 family protein [Desulfobacteraceae bacterium]|nr:TIGR02757 family protein [Desulfobacteraceae bacterium]
MKTQLDRLYARYNSREWVHPDPLEYLYHYPDLQDREVVGLIASSLAYGRVAQILNSTSAVLKKMGPSPYQFLRDATPASLKGNFPDFKHRFTTADELVAMLLGIKAVIEQYGTLYECLLSSFNQKDATVLPGLSFLVSELTKGFNGHYNSLLPLPERGSACKRLNLFLRWMVRQDHVDPGGWNEVPPDKLIVPLDTHMHRFSILLKLTRRKNADMRTAEEITDAFRKIAPQDPVRYDFALTRLGILSLGNVID